MSSSAVPLKVSAKEPIWVTPGLLNKKAKSAYSYGQCMTLALALHEHGQWPVIHFQGYLADDRLGDDYNSLLENMELVASLFQKARGGSFEVHYDRLEQAAYEQCGRANHFCVRLPDNRYLDITGAHSPEEYIKLPHLFDAGIDDWSELVNAAEELEMAQRHNSDDLEIARWMALALVTEYL